MKVCSFCYGGESEFGLGMENCRHCNGTGKEFDSHIDWKPFQAIAGTNQIFFSAMYFGINKDKLTSSQLPQLLCISSSLDSEMRSAPLNGTYSPTLVEWFCRHSNTHIAEAEKAMEIVLRKIHGKFDQYDQMNTWAEIKENGRFSLSCPGDRTCLVADRNSSFVNRGYDFYDHNLDNPAQQLVLLAGLGALCDRVRREINVP